MAAPRVRRDLRSNFQEVITDGSQTRTFRGRVIDASAHDGTVLVRLSGGSVVTANLPDGVTVEYDRKVFVQRIPGSMRHVVLGGGQATQQATTVVPAGTINADLVPHELDGIFHTGPLHDAQAPQFLKADGSRALTGNLPVDPGILIDGVDISELALGIAYNNVVRFTGNSRIGYSGDQAGIVAALAAALPRSAVRLPSREIALTTGITVPEGVSLIGLSEKAILTFSGFSGAAITMALDAVVHGFTLRFTSNGANAIGVDARFPGTHVELPGIAVKGGSTLNYGIWTGEA